VKDRAGESLVSRNFPRNYVGDVGNAAYQHSWLENVRRLLRSSGDDGVFIDSVISDRRRLAEVPRPPSIRHSGGGNKRNVLHSHRW
jgi:hypothetical protein